MKRLLGLAGSAIIGAFGAVALATPAQAHHPIISGKAICQADGQYKITWSVGNGNWSDRTARITAISSDPDTEVTGFKVDTEIAPSAEVIGTQMVPGSTTEAKLTISARWYNPNGSDSGISDTKTGSAVGVKGKCKPQPDPTATFTSNCDGTVNVHIVNPGRAEAEFTVTGIDGKIKVPGKGEKDVTVPAGAGAIVVKRGDKLVAETDGWVRPAECPKPSPLGESTCDSFIVKLTNPEGNQTVKATVTYGIQVKEKDVAPGKTETVSLSPSSQTEATVVFTGWDGAFKVKYEKPADCPGLPQTGANTFTYIASGTGLAALGLLIVFLARRRLVRLRRMASL